tara:strand:- start:3 stop:422 length:420 start_codon:yes stop_codon:yes gene_type:complete
MLIGNHWCNVDPTYGDWRIDEKDYILPLERIKKYLKKESKQLVKFSDIGYKGKNINPPYNIQERYDAADINFPGILTVGSNPYNCKYRMVDGRHRIIKMTNMGIKESMFYIIDYNIFLQRLRPVPKIYSSKQLQPNTHL